MKKALEQAQTLHQHGKLAEALLAYKKLHQQYPDNILIIQLLVLCLVQTHQLKQAKTLLQKVLKKMPHEASLFNTLGNVLSRQKKDREAQQVYQQALAITPRYPGALSNLGNSYYRCGELDQAKKCYQKAIEIDVEYPDAHFNLARLLIEENALSQAQQHLEKAIQVAPKHAGAHGLLAHIYLQHGEYTQAIEHLKERLSIQPQHLDSYQILATTLMQEKRYAEAVNALEKLLTLNPKQAEAEHMLGTAYLAAGQREEALQHYLRQLEQEKNQDTLYNIAVILSDQQRHKEAIDYFQQSLAMNPKHLPSLLNLGAVYLKNHDIPSAITQYEKVLALDPDNQEVQHILHAIRGDAVPTEAPSQYVSHLFDEYAAVYDKHLTEHLDYQVPNMLYQAVITALNPQEHSLSILDLGCGTGLAGVAFAPIAKTLVGMDLSESMLEIAEKRQLYQRLIHGSITENLNDLGCFDLVIAADVFPYIGDLSALFEKIHELLNPNGVLAFSIEKTAKADFILQKNIRYAHHIEYITRLADTYQFEIIALESAILRKQHHQNVDGYITILKALEKKVKNEQR